MILYDLVCGFHSPSLIYMISFRYVKPLLGDIHQYGNSDWPAHFTKHRLWFISKPWGQTTKDPQEPCCLIEFAKSVSLSTYQCQTTISHIWVTQTWNYSIGGGFSNPPQYRYHVDQWHYHIWHQLEILAQNSMCWGLPWNLWNHINVALHE